MGLYCILLSFIALDSIAVQCTALHHIALHSIALHCMPFHRMRQTISLTIVTFDFLKKTSSAKIAEFTCTMKE